MCHCTSVKLKKIPFDAVIRLHMHTDMSRIAVITTCYRSCLELMTTSSQLAVIITRSYTCLGTGCGMVCVKRARRSCSANSEVGQQQTLAGRRGTGAFA